MMKSLRKSLNGNKDTHRLQISTPVPLPSISKPTSATLPPQKVIRAVSSYRPQAPQQLPFQKGDFFYVTGESDNQGAWYQAHNPVTGARGLVPKTMFEEFCKSPPPIRTSRMSFGLNSPSFTSPKSPKTQVFYAVVLHDFVAERADELDAKAGDAISVVAQSNREWFVAKPIGRLGRPGLIPATFVEVRDPASNLPITDVEALMDRGDLPKVEDWKRAMQSYKQNSISLGVIEDSHAEASVADSPYMQQPNIVVQQPSPRGDKILPADPPRAPSPVYLPEGILLSADVISFHYEMDEYWFRIDAVFQPYDPKDQHRLPKAKQLILFRVYNDFYDFQVNLLESFPREAGREPPSERILPYMPGPAERVDDEITATRREELDEYLHKLCGLNGAGGSYILEHQVVREFLALKPGDVENDIEPRYDEIRALFADESYTETQADPYSSQVTQDFEDEVRDTLGDMRLSDKEHENRSDGSDYGEDHTPPTHYTGRDSQASISLRQHAHTQNHQRSASAASFCRAQSPPHLNGSSPSPSRSNSERSRSPRTYSPSPLLASQAPGDMQRTSAYSRASTASNSRWPDYTASSPSSLHSSQRSMSSRSRSHSTTTTSLSTPPISAANPQTAFVKIKIFDRVTDDLIAIRVHPRVSHAELIGKVQARLGGEVLNLRYRDSLNNEFVGIDGDEELREWMEGTEKHVLYAD